MFGSAARKVASDPARQLYESIWTFLSDHRLDPDPLNFGFAYRVLSDPGGALARAVAGFIEGGVRLTARDIESLGCRVGGSAPLTTGGRPAADPATSPDGMMARTQMQVEGFADMMDAMRAETVGFGRDLAASADAMRANSGGARDEIVRLTAAMVDRVQSAETRLQAATREANALREELEEARGDARRDPLTDLPNRRAFAEAYDAAIARGGRLCLAICDIDHFKAVNDRFGHPVGDRVLRAIGDALAQGCHNHVVARYGGEEFAVLFSGLDGDSAFATLEAARMTVAAKRYKLRETATALGEVTFSAGLVEVAAGEPFADAFRRADTLLYGAKTGGRNRVRK